MKWLLVVIYMSHPLGMTRLEAVFANEAGCLSGIETAKGSPGVIKSAECIQLFWRDDE